MPDKKVVFGAIRWDNWTRESKRRTDERWARGDRKQPHAFQNLQNKVWEKRLPFFAKVVSEKPRTVELFCDTPEIMDQEVAYAKEAGLDYWAFYYNCWNPASGICLDLYRKSEHRKDVGFCLILEPKKVDGQHPWDRTADFVVSLMTEPSYQKVLDGRPLLFLFLWSRGPAEIYGSADEARKAVKLLREKAVATGGKNPYIAAMSMRVDQACGYVKDLGLDAISAYTTFGGRDYPGLAQSNVAWWDAARKNGMPLVLPVSCGWGGPRDNGGDRKQPTPEQFGRHLRTAREWVEQNPETAASRAALIYAWNEFDEGGYLCPTRGEEPSAGKIDVLRKVTQPSDEPAG